MCTIATAKVQRNYNCHNVYFYECLLINLPSVIIKGPASRGVKQALEFIVGPHRGTVPCVLPGFLIQRIM